MRRFAAPGILALFASLALAAAGAAHADHILEEKGRELLAPDGRTLIDREQGFSIVLPASDWKVFRDKGEPMPDDTGFFLVLAPPDGEVRLRIHDKVRPVPMSLELMKAMLLKEKNPRVRNARAEIVETAGTKCLEYESESQGGKGWYHLLGRVCDASSGRQFVVETDVLSYPAERWPAEEKVVRELVGSFRILP